MSTQTHLFSLTGSETAVALVVSTLGLISAGQAHAQSTTNLNRPIDVRGRPR